MLELMLSDEFGYGVSDVQTFAFFIVPLRPIV